MLPLASTLSAKGYNVLNYGYASRAHPLAAHALDLSDAIAHRAKSLRAPALHYVAHSFGSVVLLTAAAQHGLSEMNGPSRTVLIAPPARGCELARRCHNGKFPGFNTPEAILPAVRYVTATILGSGSGKQLGSMSEDWFADQVARQGTSQIRVGDETLVVFGNVGQRVNPFIGSDNDGVVAVNETVLSYPHYRNEHALTHNLLLYSPSVIQRVTSFLANGGVNSNSELYSPHAKAPQDL
jgi:pimeloyl-ACP methyl ester carboxylesterase